MNILFTRSTYNLKAARWASVQRDEYLAIVRRRKAECAAFSAVDLDENAADASLLQNGVPEAVKSCL